MRPVDAYDDLLAELRRVVTEADGPPEAVRAAARAAFLARDLDGELAVLIADSRAADGDYEPVRAMPEPAQGRWLLSFEGGGVQVDMEVDEQHDRVRLLGQFSGTSGSEFFLESATGLQRLDVDEIGRFIVAGVTHGAVRLRCRSADGARITTVWVTV